MRCVQGGVCLADPHDGARATSSTSVTPSVTRSRRRPATSSRTAEAVALGMVAALRLSGNETALAAVRTQLDPKPVRVDREAAWAALARDKKTVAGTPRLVLLERWRRADVGQRAPGGGRACGTRRPDRRLESRRCASTSSTGSISTCSAGATRRSTASQSIQDLETQIYAWARELDLQVRCRQTDHEGEYVGFLHQALGSADGLIVNPGAWTHYSWAIHDALEPFAGAVRRGAPLERRRARGVAAALGADGPRRHAVVGKGFDGYREALALLNETAAR